MKKAEIIKQLEVEKHNHTMTRIAWAETTKERDDLKEQIKILNKTQNKSSQIIQNN